MSRGQASAALRKAFASRGYARQPNPERFDEGSGSYKKGWEVRLVADTKREVAELRKYLREVGLRAGNPFLKHSSWVLPIYGQDAVNWFTSKKQRR